MSNHADNPQAAASSKATRIDSEQGSQPFLGFEPLHSNYVFCPNQFFDICLKSSSRGMVRSVAFILRQTLGWLDSDGQPVNQTVRIPYSRLQKEANVSERAIPKAIQLALACNFIECIVAPSPDQKNQAGTAGEYTLKWDTTRSFAKSLADFNGFYTGEGHRSPIPNSFFDMVVPNESLSVAKVVGAVLRHTIGYENQFGGRRMTHPLSCTTLQNFTGISDRKTIIAAIRRSIEAGYIERVEEGQFHPDQSIQATAVYGVHWLGQAKTKPTSAKTLPAADDRKIPTSTTAEIPPANHGNKPTSIEKTKQKDILKQQVAVDFDSETKQRLTAEGFDAPTVHRLLEKRGVEVIQRQLDWIDARKPKNRLAMLRKAIEEDWSEPASFAMKRKLTTARKREAMHDAAKLSEEGIINQRKAARASRKTRLMIEWDNATLVQRADWISAAAKRQTATMLQQIIAKQKPTTQKPHAQVLDEVAFAKSLPSVTESARMSAEPAVAEQPNPPPSQSAIESKPRSLGSPQTEKTPTELASF